ncbi:MAG TPA: 2TM domain-containing protein, partial [Polyangiaceae bacterium]|nr:2TM domain-containing protein [Polyangiaceae bacterium]
MPERTYSDEQVREILRRAVERGAGTGGIERDDLIAAAADVGIDRDAVHAAIVELESEGEVKEELAKLRGERRRSLASNFGTWAIVSSGLFGIDWATGGGWWFYWPLGGWGILLLLELKGLLLANPTRDQEQAARRVAQR